MSDELQAQGTGENEQWLIISFVYFNEFAERTHTKQQKERFINSASTFTHVYNYSTHSLSLG